MVSAKTTHVHTLIIGGGITGLATAYALGKHGMHDYLVVEAQDRLGGLCATTRQDGYQFDFAGHLLHLHTPQGKELIQTLLGNNLQKHTRRAFIYTHGMQVPYPFQQNLWALYPELRALCVEELTRLQPATTAPENFEQWCLQSFGHGLCEAFFRPYNEKLWGRPLRELTCEWCHPFVPSPHYDEILQSATHKPTRAPGYNATFYYPRKGGIGALINALAKHVANVHTNSPVTCLNLSTKTAWIQNYGTVHFEHLVNTAPLTTFVNLLEAQEPLKQAASRLAVQPITVYHVAIARSVFPFSWIYFPDKNIPFYRVGLQSSFCTDAVAAKDTSLFYIELPGSVPHTPAHEKQIWTALHQQGIISWEDTKLFSAWQDIPHAYVVFNRQRAQSVPFLLSELKKQGVFCAGRYGRWTYSFMEYSLREGQQLAQQLAKLV